MNKKPHFKIGKREYLCPIIEYLVPLCLLYPLTCYIYKNKIYLRITFITHYCLNQTYNKRFLSKTLALY